jgi:hypothetical protein
LLIFILLHDGIFKRIARQNFFRGLNRSEFPLVGALLGDVWPIKVDVDGFLLVLDRGSLGLLLLFTHRCN